jgi:hypothetical protein
MEPDQAAGVLRTALAGQTGDATVADAAARSGLALRDAELGLHRLLSAHLGHLSVTDKGELLFRFPTGFAIDYERRGRAQALVRRVGRGVAGIAKWIVRVGLAVFLVGYAVVFALGLLVGAIALSIAAEDSAPLEGAGFLLWGMADLVGDALFWGFHPRASLVGDGEHRHPRAFYERVNRLFFGPPREAGDPHATRKLLASEIRARSGRIGLGDVVRVTGLPRAEAEATVSRLLVDYDGQVDVTEDGAIVYRFPELRPTAGPKALPAAPVSPVPAIWRGALEKEPFTGNSTGSNVGILMLTAFVGAMGGMGTWLGLPLWAAELPLFATLVFMTVPLVRIPFFVARRGAIEEENGRRALLRVVHESACEAQAIDEDDVAAAWQGAAGRPIAVPDLRRMLVEMGGEATVDELARALWRFPDLELELHALAVERSTADDSERDAGTIEFTSLPAEDSSPALALAPAPPTAAAARRTSP